ncbi:MAG: prepilin-type N-terminal cleavage/methylation domain-containing protein [Planctomycetota bacterium]
MSISVVRRRPALARKRRVAFTLIELLIVIAIIALLISILLPALSAAREEGRRVMCLSNMKAIGGAMNQYLGNDDQNNLPWTYIYRIDNLNRPRPYPDTGATSYSWAGGRGLRPRAGQQQWDVNHVPAELRPFNKYLDESAIDDQPVKILSCPGDRSDEVLGFGEVIDDPKVESAQTSFETLGNSYSINWFFMDEPELSNWALSDLFEHGKQTLQLNRGAKGAEFVVFWENEVEPLFSGASLAGGGGRLGPGWHRRFSYHTFTFLDGHVENRFFDTRNVKGNGWRIWRKWTWYADGPH